MTSGWAGSGVFYVLIIFFISFSTLSTKISRLRVWTKTSASEEEKKRPAVFPQASDALMTDWTGTGRGRTVYGQDGKDRQGKARQGKARLG